MKARLGWPEQRRQQVSVLLTIIALLLWSHSIIYARLEIGHWGLIGGIPATFFVALSLLTVASALLWVAKEKHGKLLCLQLLILILALGSISLMTGGSHQFTNHGYRNLGYVDYIVRNGHFDVGVSTYFGWPGAFVLSAIVAKIGSVNPEPLVPVIGFICPILTVLPLYIFLKNTLGGTRSNYIWPGCWLYFLAAGGGGGNLISAMGTAFFLVVVLLALITGPWSERKDAKSIVFVCIAAVLFAAIAITHLLTALAVLGIMAALALVRLDKRLAVAASACLVLLLAWSLTGTGSFVQKRLPTSEKTSLVEYVPVVDETPPPGEVSQPAETPPPGEVSQPAETPPPGEVSQSAETPPPDQVSLTTEVPSSTKQPRRGMVILDPDVLLEREVTGHLSGSQSHIDIVRIRIIFAGMFAAVGLVGLIYALVNRRDLRTTIALLAMTVAPLVLVVLSGHYAKEILGRLYAFTLPGMAYFGANLLNIRNKAAVVSLCVLLIVAVPLTVIADYGNQELDYFSPEQRAATLFFHNQTSQGIVAGAWPMGLVENIEQYGTSNLEDLKWEDGKLVRKSWWKQGVPYYVAISRQNRARYGWFKGNTQFIGELEEKLQSTVDLDFIYNNPHLKLYISDS